MQVKICGITRLQDARFAANAGASMLGLNFYPQSSRYIAPLDAAVLCYQLRAEFEDACPLLVGVFVNANPLEIRQIMAQVRLDFAQLSGDESPESFAQLGAASFKAIRPVHAAEAHDTAMTYAPYFLDDPRAPSLLLDAYHFGKYGGTGKQTTVEIAHQVRQVVPRLMLAGGLTPQNVAEQVEKIQPWGVDVASGVEHGFAGIKDIGKMREFILEATRGGEINQV